MSCSYRSGINAIIAMYKDNAGIIWLGTYKQENYYYSVDY